MIYLPQKSTGSNKGFIALLPILSFAILLVGTAVTTYLVQNKQDIRNFARDAMDFEPEQQSPDVQIQDNNPPQQSVGADERGNQDPPAPPPQDNPQPPQRDEEAERRQAQMEAEKRRRDDEVRQIQQEEQERRDSIAAANARRQQEESDRQQQDIAAQEEADRQEQQRLSAIAADNARRQEEEALRQQQQEEEAQAEAARIAQQNADKLQAEENARIAEENKRLSDIAAVNARRQEEEATRQKQQEEIVRQADQERQQRDQLAAQQQATQKAEEEREQQELAERQRQLAQQNADKLQAEEDARIAEENKRLSDIAAANARRQEEEALRQQQQEEVAAKAEAAKLAFEEAVAVENQQAEILANQQKADEAIKEVTLAKILKTQQENTSVTSPDIQSSTLKLTNLPSSGIGVSIPLGGNTVGYGSVSPVYGSYPSKADIALDQELGGISNAALFVAGTSLAGAGLAVSVPGAISAATAAAPGIITTAAELSIPATIIAQQAITDPSLGIDLASLGSGRDLITGNDLSPFDRGLIMAGVVLPGVSGVGATGVMRKAGGMGEVIIDQARGTATKLPLSIEFQDAILEQRYFLESMASSNLPIPQILNRVTDQRTGLKGFEMTLAQGTDIGRLLERQNGSLTVAQAQSIYDTVVDYQKRAKIPHGDVVGGAQTTFFDNIGLPYLKNAFLDDRPGGLKTTLIDPLPGAKEAFNFNPVTKQITLNKIDPPLLTISRELQLLEWCLICRTQGQFKPSVVGNGLSTPIQVPIQAAIASGIHSAATQTLKTKPLR